MQGGERDERCTGTKSSGGKALTGVKPRLTYREIKPTHNLFTDAEGSLYV